MATLVMKDGAKRYAGHSQAAKIYQVIIGNEQPENDEQRAFADTVERVEFEKLADRHNSKREVVDPEIVIERRRKIAAIDADPKIKGRDKYYAIGEVLYGKKVRRQQELAA